jgi:hypothetical protein
MDCYNCGELGHLAHQCPKPKKDKYKKKTRARKMTQVMMMMRRRKQAIQEEGWQEKGFS